MKQTCMQVVLSLAILFTCHSCAFALDPSLDISQYAHTAWKTRDGFCKGAILAIAQTPDGYVWLGTEFGLFRFDGVRPVLWQPPEGQQLPGTFIRSLLTARDGRLWIGTGQGLASWKDGKLTRYVEPGEQTVWTLLEDRNGTIWTGGHFASTAAKLCAIHGSNVRCYGDDGSFGQHVDSLFEDRSGSLWVGGVKGLWRWKPGPAELYPMPDRSLALLDDNDGALMIAMNRGVRQFRQGKLGPSPLPVSGRRFSPRAFLRDRDGALWIGTADHGLVHIHDGRTDVFEHIDGLSSDFIEQVFEDREGNIWVATLDGLDRFREFAVTTLSPKQGLSNATVKSVLAARDGSVWLGTNGGLNRWNHGLITVYRVAANASGSGGGLPDNSIQSLFEDYRNQIWVASHEGVAYLRDGQFTRVAGLPGGETHSIAGDREGNIWISQEASLLHLHDGILVERVPWASLGSPDEGRSLIADPSGGGLWIAFRRGSVAYFKDGQIRMRYTVADGLGKGDIRDFQLDRQGAFWISTEGGLTRLKDGRIATLSSQNGLPCDAVLWAMEDDDHFFWISMACGLVRVARSELDGWAATAHKSSGPRVSAAVFDISDGVMSHRNSTGYSPSVAKTADGKLWFLPWDGVSVIDPRHLPLNKLPPPVHIEQIAADGKVYDASNGLRLPPQVRNLTIDYTALSFVAPEKIHFRYKLEGQDPDWREVVNDRKVQYSNLAPHRYRSRVMACNNDGVWNEAGASLDFSVLPAYYQTVWFRLACAVAFLGLLWGIYQLRVQQLQRQFAIGLEARVNERTRIARELHDTLLQSLHGLMFQFQAVRNLLIRRPEEAARGLDDAIDQTEKALAESRDAIQGIRSEPMGKANLAEFLAASSQNLTSAGTGKHETPVFELIEEGKRRALSSMANAEVGRIALELLRNAFRHAQATRIEAEIRYDDQMFRVRIRDDGRGIDPKVLKEGGTAGHWGLRGIRERAERIGSHLEFWSEAGAGTEVQLTVPAAVAYETSTDNVESRLFRKKRNRTR